MSDTFPISPGPHSTEFSFDEKRFTVRYVVFELINLITKTSHPFVNEWTVYDSGFDRVSPPATTVWDAYCASEQREGRPLPVYYARP